jgi:hypothetical protein
MKTPEMNKPILMVGVPRSGTTMLSEILSSHPDLGWFSNYVRYFPALPWLAVFDRITSISEIGWFLRGQRRQRDGLGSFLRRCLPHPAEAFPVWSRCCGEKFLWEYLVGMAASEEEKRRMIEYVRKVLSFQGKKRFFAKITGPPRIFYLNSLFEDAFYVHVIRDPRAVVSSLLVAPFWKIRGGHVRPWWLNGLTDQDMEEWNLSGKSPVALGAIQWKRIIEMAWEEKTLIPPGRYLEVRYEDFAEKPGDVLRRILEKLELKDSEVAHRYLTSIGKVKNMNFKYKEHLGREDIALICRITSKTAIQAGYDL